jgi:hypothetical protein
MKLYPILFLNEAAKTPEQAISEGVAVISADIWNDTILLVNVQTIINAFQSHGYDLQLVADVIFKKNGIVGLMDYTKKESDLYKVNASAGILDYGPLAYQITMQHIGNNNWLACDTSLKPASKYVWQKMFEFSNKGVYKRKWLGTWSFGLLVDRSDIEEGINEYIQDIEDNNIDYKNEQEFLDWLEVRGLKPENYGFLWAYNLSSPINVRSLYVKGKETVENIAEENENSNETIVKTIAEAARQFWDKMYGSEASYSE